MQTRSERRARYSKRNLVHQVVTPSLIYEVDPPRQVIGEVKVLFHRKHFNDPRFGDFRHWWKQLNEMPKQNSKRSKKRGLNAVFNIE